MKKSRRNRRVKRNKRAKSRRRKTKFRRRKRRRRRRTYRGGLGKPPSSAPPPPPPSKSSKKTQKTTSKKQKRVKDVAKITLEALHKKKSKQPAQQPQQTASAETARFLTPKGPITKTGSYLYPAPITLDNVNSIVFSCLNPSSLDILMVSSSMNLYFGVFAILINIYLLPFNPL